MNKIKGIIKRLILEDIKNFGEIYHITSEIESILKSDTINLSLGLGADNYGKKFFFLSLSRTPSVKIGYKAGYLESRIVFDYNKLKSNFEIMPVDYWGWKGKNMESNWQPSMFEFEERLLSNKSDISNIGKYIKRIEIAVRENNFNNFNYVERLKSIINLSKSRGIDVYFYKSNNDFRLGKNRIDSNQIMNINLPKEDRYNSNSSYERYENLIALMMYDDKYLNDYNLFVNDLKEFLPKIGLSESDIKDSYTVYSMIRDLEGSDVMRVDSDLRGYFKSGKSGKYRQVATKFINQMKKLGVRSIEEYVKLKRNKIKPKGEKKDYSKNWGLYELVYNYDTSDFDTWESISNEIKLKNLERIYFQTYKYGGYLSNEDGDEFYKIKLDENGTVGQFINYLMNKYTLDKVKQIIYNSGYDSIDKRYSFKLDKIN
jgi:hypothetical protein